MTSVLFVDNFDSFTFNLVDELSRRDADVQVWRNDIAASDALRIAEALAPPRLVVVSPGPGKPSDAGCCIELIQKAGDIPLFGVCLGHQAIVEAFGGQVGYAGEVVHGKAAKVSHDGTGLFRGLTSPMFAARYHSLAAARLPASLRATAHVGELVMAVEHQQRPVAGVQFHPESILTPRGGVIIDNVVRWASER